MQTLNLPIYKFRIKSNENKLFIFDILRKKYVVLTPEEWVRQHFVHYLIEEKNDSGSSATFDSFSCAHCKLMGFISF